MAAPDSPPTEANKPTDELKCSACGKATKNFSNRQKNKALMGEPARCKECIESDTPVKKESDATAEKKEKLYFSDGESISEKSSSSIDDSTGSNDENQDVSLDALKEKILGRKLVTHNDAITDDKLPFIQNATELKKELSCAICHEILFHPTSLTCGHSFCRECLQWWLSRSDAGRGSCPTCRSSLNCSGDSLKVNVALHAAVTALYGEELQERNQAEILRKLKATAGEHGGAHDRGNEVLSELATQDFQRLSGGLLARRSVVLDDQDVRMQYALAVDSRPCVPKPAVMRKVLQVSITLLTMEEDEVEDGGIPIMVQDEDDAHLMVQQAGGSDGIKASIVGSDGSDLTAETVHDGAFYFSIALQDFPARVCFRHERTGAEFEIQVPREPMAHGREQREREPFSPEEDEGPNEYEDDGFVVMHDESSASESDHEEDDVCCLCRKHGDMIVCDGGDNLEGCGKSFHIHCIHREEVPPGDWVCGDCASAIDLDVGIEGHEFPPDSPKKIKERCA